MPRRTFWTFLISCVAFLVSLFVIVARLHTQVIFQVYFWTMFLYCIDKPMSLIRAYRDSVYTWEQNYITLDAIVELPSTKCPLSSEIYAFILNKFSAFSLEL